MGYDMDMAVLKKKSLEVIQKILPDYTFKDIYSSFLFSRLYPDDYEVAEDERGRWITWANRNIFYDFFEPKLENDEAIIINESTYNKMLNWLEEKLKSKTLYDIAINKDDDECDEYELVEIIRIYRQMKKEKIDYETEFVVYQHDW